MLFRSAIPFFLIGLVVVAGWEAMRQVPQQQAWVVERLGKFHTVLEPGLNWITPFLDKVAYRHSLKETPLDVPEQVCITKDNTQLGVDGIIYYQVTDPKLASYGSSNYVAAVTQLAQTTLRSEIGKMELDKTFESRDEINRQVVSVLDEAGRTWGVKVLRYEIKNLTPPEAILRSMQAQITAEREKRALIAKSEGQRQEEINLAEGVKQAAGFFLSTAVSLILVFANGPATLRTGAKLLLTPWAGSSAAGAFSIAVAPGNATVAKNGDQLVAATLNGFTAEQTTLLVRSEGAPGWTRLDMARDSSGRWTFRLFDVGAATDYAVEAAGVRSPTYRLEVAPIPYVARVDLEYRYPAYTQLAPRQVDSTGDIAALTGSMVRVRITPTVPATDRKSTRLNSSHVSESRMPSSA